MNGLQELVGEALARRRVVGTGCFVHNAAAVELLKHGLDAISAIENEILNLAAQEPPLIPADLASVMVIYSRLLRRFEVGDRCVPFLRHLPPPIRERAIASACAAWDMKDPTFAILPTALRSYIEEISASGTNKERHEAERVLQRYKKDRTT